MTERLQLHEAADFARYEEIIERGIATFYDVGTALLHIRDERLYRATHDTFQTYCRERWNMRRRYADQVIAAATVMGNLRAQALTSEPTPVIPSPVMERQVRPLAALSPEDQRTVWAAAVEESDGEQPAPMKVAELSKLVKTRIKERRAEAGIVESAAEPTGGDELPPMSRQEFREWREECHVNEERNAQVWSIIHAFEVLNAPPLPLAEIAAEILEMNGPDVDWVAQAENALRNLKTLITELHK